MSRLKMRALLLFVPLIISINSLGQSEQPLLDDLIGKSEIDQVDYVLNNFYKIYSANFDEAIEATRFAQKISREHNWEDKEAYALMYNGIANYLRGNYKEALNSFQASSTIFEKINDLDGIARLNNEKSVFYRKIGNTKKAFEALDKAEKTALEANNLEQLGTNYGMRGNIFIKNGEFDKAQPYFEKVLEIRLKQNDSVGLGYVYLDFARYEFYKGRYDNSKKYVELSTAIRKGLGDEQGVAINYQHIGENYYNLKQFEKAIPYFRQAIEIASPIGYIDLIRNNYDFLQKSYVAIGDFKKAHRALSEYRILNDSLFNIEKARTIEELHAKYETENKDQEILFLNQENALQKANNQRNIVIIAGLTIAILLSVVIFYLWLLRYRAKQKEVLNEQRLRLREAQMEAIIDSQEKERKRFAADLHDGMGQLVAALNVNIQSLNENSDLEKSTQIHEASTEILNDIQAEIRNIAFNLMPQILVKEGLVNALQELINRINKSNKIHLKLSTYEFNYRLSEVIEISIYRIIQEWLSNILKYNNAQSVYLQFTAHEDELILTIEDDGTGFDPDKMRNSNGNGWRNISTRVNLISGELTLDTNPNRKGTTMILSIPVKHSMEINDLITDY